MNATAPARARQRKPRPKPARSIKLALPPRDGGPGVVEIRVGKTCASYFLYPLPSDFGRAFRLDKFTAPGGESYHVLLSADGKHSCECKGFLRHGHCKHADGLAALQKAGRLPDAAQTAPSGQGAVEPCPADGRSEVL